jgi:hypothetical protein
MNNEEAGGLVEKYPLISYPENFYGGIIMDTLFGILTVEQWLAILRIGIGLWWLKSFLHKPHKKFVSGQLVSIFNIGR